MGLGAAASERPRLPPAPAIPPNEAPRPTPIVEKPVDWPSQSDVDLAKRSDFTYTDSKGVEVPREVDLARMGGIDKDFKNDIYLKESDRPEEDRNRIYAARLAALRSPLAELGFHAARFGLVNSDISDKVFVNGVYQRNVDSGFAGRNSPDALVHEALHRGVGILQREFDKDPLKFVQTLREKVGIYEVQDTMVGKVDPVSASQLTVDDDRKLGDLTKSLFTNEILVRALMLKHFGGIERESGGSLRQIEEGKQLMQSNPRLLEAYEELAREYLERTSRKQGPR